LERHLLELMLIYTEEAAGVVREKAADTRVSKSIDKVIVDKQLIPRNSEIWEWYSILQEKLGKFNFMLPLDGFPISVEDQMPYPSRKLGIEGEPVQTASRREVVDVSKIKEAHLEKMEALKKEIEQAENEAVAKAPPDAEPLVRMKVKHSFWKQVFALENNAFDTGVSRYVGIPQQQNDLRIYVNMPLILNERDAAKQTLSDIYEGKTNTLVGQIATLTQIMIDVQSGKRVKQSTVTKLFNMARESKLLDKPVKPDEPDLRKAYKYLANDLLGMKLKLPETDKATGTPPGDASLNGSAKPAYTIEMHLQAQKELLVTHPQGKFAFGTAVLALEEKAKLAGIRVYENPLIRANGIELRRAAGMPLTPSGVGEKASAAPDPILLAKKHVNDMYSLAFEIVVDPEIKNQMEEYKSELSAQKLSAGELEAKLREELFDLRNDKFAKRFGQLRDEGENLAGLDLQWKQQIKIAHEKVFSLMVYREKEMKSSKPSMADVKQRIGIPETPTEPLTVNTHLAQVETFRNAFGEASKENLGPEEIATWRQVFNEMVATANRTVDPDTVNLQDSAKQKMIGDSGVVIQLHKAVYADFDRIPKQNGNKQAGITFRELLTFMSVPVLVALLIGPIIGSAVGPPLAWITTGLLLAGPLALWLWQTFRKHFSLSRPPKIPQKNLIFDEHVSAAA